MNIFAPSYYKNFKCIAENCKHSCCIGWEIDIDEETANFYKSADGQFGNKLMNSITFSDESYHFILSDKERCPFLNEQNLCDIILTLGEDNLCQICTDHPRFRNFFENRIEIGLGLCCEAAGKLILNNKSKFKLVEPETNNAPANYLEEEIEFFNFRNSIFDMIQNRNLSMDNRIQNVILKLGIKIPRKSISEWTKIYLKLEHNDNSWILKLNEIKDSKLNSDKLCLNDEFDIVFEQLLIYFIYRHMTDGIYDGKIKERIAFSILSVSMIRIMCSYHKKKNKCISIDDIIEISRLYSSEIEYSDENTNILLELLSE